MLVTDAIAAAGLVEGVHQLGRLAVDVKYINTKDPKRRRGSAQLAGTCTLAGRYVRIFIKYVMVQWSYVCICILIKGGVPIHVRELV